MPKRFEGEMETQWCCAWCDPLQEAGAAVVVGNLNYGICDACLKACLAEAREKPRPAEKPRLARAVAPSPR